MIGCIMFSLDGYGCLLISKNGIFTLEIHIASEYKVNVEELVSISVLYFKKVHIIGNLEFLLP